MESHQMLKDTTIFIIARYISFFFVALTGILVARFLGPELFGIYSALMLITLYSQSSHLGVIDAILKKIPYYLAKKKENVVSKIKNNTFSFSLLICVLIALVVFGISFFLKNILSSETISGMRLVSVIIILQQVYFFYLQFFNAKKNFKLLSIVMVIYSVLNFFFVLILIFPLRLKGVLMASIASYSLVAIYIFRKGDLNLKFMISPGYMFKLFKIGFPIFFIGFLHLILKSIDRFMIIRFFDKASLGYYSIGVFAIEALAIIPAAIGQNLFPRVVERFGGKRDIKCLRDYHVLPALISSYLLPFVLGAAFIVGDFFIRAFLPKYIEGIFAFKILVIVVFFMAYVEITARFLITIDKQRRVITMMILSIALTGVLAYLFIRNGAGIEGAAFAMLLGYIFVGTALLFSAFSHYSGHLSEKVGEIVRLYLPIAVNIVLLLAMDRLFYGVPYYISVSVKLFLLAAVNMPFFSYVNKKTGVISLMLNHLVALLHKMKK